MRTQSQNSSPQAPGSQPPRSGRPPALLLRGIHSLYAWGVFMLLASLALLAMAVVPSLAGRRRAARFTGRAALTLAGMPVSARLPAHFPQPCIVVANHESYLDGIVLAATLPPQFAFVIKREVDALPLGGWLLRRLGAQFVARGQRAGSARDALRVLRQASRGQSLAFFPEGTFRPEPGLMRFHTGAFAAAELAGAPVLPLAIFGTRRCLPPGGFLTRPGLLRVQALGLLHPQGGRQDAAALRDAAHAAIASAIGAAPIDANVPTGDTKPGAR
jgi:1-acyl-sn-glycerol-3-phosphate acyltransferase